MTKPMNKLLTIAFIGILGGITAIILLLANLTSVVQGPPEKLGNIAGTIQRVASSSATYFGTNEGTRTATGTLLTIAGVDQATSITLGVQVGASTTVGTVRILPQASFDAVTWYDLNPQTITSTAGTIAAISLNTEGTALLTYAPADDGNTMFTFKNIEGKFMRFQVSTTGTSTVLLEGFKRVNN